MKQTQNRFFQSVAILFTGSVLAQLISFAAMPVISRLFSPEDNAYFGLFIKLATMIATVSTARLEFVFPTLKAEHHAFALYKIAFRLSFFLSIGLLFLALASLFFLEKKSVDDIALLLSVPLGVLVISWFNLGNNWELREEGFVNISRANVLLSFVGGVGKIAVGFFYASSWVLIVTTIFAYLFASLGFLKKFFQTKSKYLIRTNSPKSKYLLYKNRDFYTFNLFHVLMDLIRESGIYIFLLSQYGKFDSGSFDFGNRMLKLPVLIIAGSMAQVFFKKAQDKIHQHQSIKELSNQILLTSLGIALVTYIVVFFFAEDLFAWVFGAKWKIAGQFSILMTPWLLLNFIFTPFSYLPILMKKQRTFFWINTISIIVLIPIVLLAYYFKFNIEQAIQSISYYYCVYFCVLLTWFWHLNSKYSKTLA